MSDSASRPPSPRPLAAMSLIAVIFINMLGFGIIVPLLPFYGKSFDAPAWQIAIMFSGYAVGSFFGEPFWGRLSDRYGRKPILVSTICGNCLCYLALAFAPNVWAAFAIRLCGGLASGNGAVIQGYIADVTPPEKRSGRMAQMGAAWNVGLIFGPFLGGIFAHPELGPAGFRAPLFIAAGLAILSAGSVALFIRESRVREMGISVRPARWSALGEALRHPVISRLMLLTFLVGFAFNGIEATFGLWAQAKFEWGPRDIAFCFFFMGIASTLIQTTLTGWLSERYGEGRMLAVGMALTTLALVGLPLVEARAAVIALMTLTAVGNSVAFPNVGALISRAADPHRQGQILGLNNAASALSRVTGPLSVSLAFSSITIDAPFWVAAIIVAPAILLALTAARRARAS